MQGISERFIKVKKFLLSEVFLLHLKYTSMLKIQVSVVQEFLMPFISRPFISLKKVQVVSRKVFKAIYCIYSILRQSVFTPFNKG